MPKVKDPYNFIMKYLGENWKSPIVNPPIHFFTWCEGMAAWTGPHQYKAVGFPGIHYCAPIFITRYDKDDYES